MNFLRTPYPLYRAGKVWVVLSLLSGVFIAFFLIIFQPFGTYNFQHPNKTLFLTGYGLITTVCMLFWGFMNYKLPSVFREQRWTIGKQTIWLLLIVLSIAVSSFLYSLWFNSYEFQLLFFINFVFYVFIIGLFPVAVVTASDYFVKFKKYADLAEKVEVKTAPENREKITILDENNQLVLTLAVADFLFAQSFGNYNEVHFFRNSLPEKLLIRNSLKNLFTSVHAEIISCHRSYLVNLQHIDKVTGNSQGLHLHFVELDETVPVSRSQVKRVMSLLEDK